MNFYYIALLVAIIFLINNGSETWGDDADEVRISILIIFIISVISTYVATQTIRITEEGIKYTTFLVFDKVYKWGEIERIGYQEVYVKNVFEPKRYMCIITNDNPIPEKSFMSKLCTKNYLAFVLPGDEEYNEIFKYYDERTIVNVDIYADLPGDYTTSSYEMEVLFVIAIAIGSLIFPLTGHWESVPLLLMLAYATLKEVMDKFFYAQYQINSDGVGRVAFGEIKEKVTWDEIKDVVIREIEQSSMAAEYRPNHKIYLCFKEQDISNGKADIHKFALQGQSHFCMEYNKRNFDLITKYYPIEKMKRTYEKTK